MGKKLIDKEYISIKDVATLTGVPVETLKKRVQRNKYAFRKVSSAGRNGLKYEILISSLEIELQEKICSKLSIGGSLSLIKGDTCNNTTSPVFLKSFLHGNLLINDGTAQDAAACSSTSFIPTKAKEIALAKYNIVIAWRNFRNEQQDKKKADNEFLALYTSKLILPNAYNLIGKVSISSINRWNKTLKDNNDSYYTLINDYKYISESQLNTTLTDEEKQDFIKLYYNDSQLDVSTVYSLIKYQYNKINKPTKSLSTYRRFANFIKRNHYDFEVVARQGEKALKDKVVPSIRRNTDFLQVGDILVADGNKLDFMIINPFTGKPARAVMVVFQDWYSKDFVGYEIMFSENTQCISSALRNSIIRLGKIPKVVYMDNGRAFRGKYFTGTKSFDDTNFVGIYAQLGIKTTFAKPYNGKAKIVERSFGEFVKSCPPLVSSYIGSSISKQPAHLKRNEKFHKELHKNDKVPTIEQAKLIIEEWLKYYRSKQHNIEKDKTIDEVLNAGKGQGIDESLLDELMMQEEIRSVKRSTIRIFGHEYTSNELYALNDKVIIKYSLFDISKLKVYSLSGEYICEAETVLQYNAMAKYFGNVTDIYSLKQAQKLQNAQIKSSLKKTKLIMGKTNPFDSLPWGKLPESEDIKEIENNTQNENEPKKKKVKYEITGYEHFHLYQQPKVDLWENVKFYR